MNPMIIRGLVTIGTAVAGLLAGRKLLATNQEKTATVFTTKIKTFVPEEPQGNTYPDFSNKQEKNTLESTTMTENFIAKEPHGNIYLDFARNVDDFTGRGRVYPGLRTQLENLRKKYTQSLFPSLQTGDDIVSFFRDTFFPNDRVQTLLLSNLTLGDTPKEVTLLIRPEVLLPSMDMELPTGLTLAIKANYRIESVNKQTQFGSVTTTPLLVVREVIAMPHCDKRDFEQELPATIFSAYSFNDYIRGGSSVSFRNNNAVSLDFVEKLPKISQETQKHLKDWYDYLDFWEKYTKSQLDGLRFVKAEFVKGTYRFLVVTESPEMFQNHCKFFHKDGVQIFLSEYSSDPWTFKLNEENSYLKGIPLGDHVKSTGKQSLQSVSLPEDLKNKTGFENPYCVWVSFNLSDEQQDKYDARLTTISTKQESTKLEVEFLNRIPQSGWLSTSASGDLTVINRLRCQLKILQEQGGYAPFLSSYLFNIKNARQPQVLVEITDWMNSNLNEDQKNAVRKMLSVPDTGLIQGPPGTGKTSVIAELICQCVKRGMTVGVFSQANLAVDNALERLAADPHIRAVRLGKKADADCPYHQDNALETYYTAVAENCRKNTLDNWVEWEQQIETLKDWLNKTEFLYEDVIQLNEARNRAETDYDREEARNEFSAKRTLLLALMNQKRTDSKVTDYPQLREAVEKQLQNVQTQSNNLRPIKEIWSDILTDWTDDLAKQTTLQHDKSSYINDEYIRSCNVVGVSCTENTRTLMDAGHPHFDVVIIDEVSKATPPELIMPMLLGKKAILVGDHLQLPPVFKHKGVSFDETSFGELVAEQEETEQREDVLTEDNLKRFEKMVSASWFKEQFEKAPEALKVSLWTQYRSHPNIMRCFNPFYNGRLTCGLQNPDEERQHGLTLTGVRNRSLLKPEQHVLWIDSGTLPIGQPNYEQDTGTGKVNTLEAALIVKMLMQMEQEYLRQGVTAENQKQVAVITFYGKQLREIRNAIRRAGKFTALNVSVNTVDKFQGQERPIVFVSMVRCPEGKLSRLANTASFERINVAFSRAQELLVIVGATKTFNSYPVELPISDNTGKQSVNVYKKIIDEIDRNACLHTARDILTVPEYNRFIGASDTPHGQTSRPIVHVTNNQQERNVSNATV